MSSYVVAADGGNSKTDLVLADLDGTILDRRQLPGTRPHLDGGIEVMADALSDGVRRARADAGLSDVVPVHGVFCLANVDLVEDEELTCAALLARRTANVVVVQNDTFAILRAGTDKRWGVAVVAGAGVNALGVHPDGRAHRFLALGEFTGDWGGGYSLGIGAVGAAVRAEDGRGPRTVLTQLVPLAFGRPDTRSVAVAIHRGAITEHDLLRLAPVVLDAALQDDEAASALVTRLADELVDFAAAAMRGLGLTDLDTDIVLGGGVLQSGNRLLLDRLTDQIRRTAPHAAIITLQVSPVVGALVIALREAGAEPQAIARARHQLRST